MVGLALIALYGCTGDDNADSAETLSAATAPTTSHAVTSTAAATVAPALTAPPSPEPTTVPQTSAPATSAPTTTVAESGIDPRTIVATLASDELAGRNDGTDGWRAAQEFLAEQLAAISQPAFADLPGVNGYIQEGPSANVVGIIQGSELPEQYVVIGAHYDGLGDAAVGAEGCAVLDPADTICNGAADNAASVAAVLAVAASVAESGPPRRSLLIAFWDREEDGLVGSADFLAAPVVPVDEIVTYLNFDIQGANLSPSLRDTTVMVGAETGGPALVRAATRAAQSSTLQTLVLSLVFGQGRSDHANFVNAGVPSVFFTDSNNGCYHTTRDDITTVDFAKLDQQIGTAVALTQDMLATNEVPLFVTDAPVATYVDAVNMLDVVQTARPDIGLLTAPGQAAYQQYVVELQAIVDEGEAAFDAADVGPLLSGAAALVDALAHTECDGYQANAT